MTDILLLYLFTRLDVLTALLKVSLVIGVVAGGGVLFFACMTASEQDDCSWVKKYAPRGAVALILLAVLHVATPSSKDLAIIVGGKIAVDAIRSPQAQEMSQMVLEAVRKKLNEER